MPAVRALALPFLAATSGQRLVDALTSPRDDSLPRVTISFPACLTLVAMQSDSMRPALTATADAPRFLENLVCQAEAAGASDIHLQRLGASAAISFRLDGVMTPIA